MTRTVTVKPISSKAKNRFANTMDGNPVCTVEQDTGKVMFLVSENRKYSFWASVSDDTHWEVL